MQRLANETGLSITVCHFPPGTSKWNKLEHRLFSYISQNWRGKPLVSHEVIVNLIAATTTRTGLRVEAALDTNSYPKGIKVSDAEIAEINFIGTLFTVSGTIPLDLRNCEVIIGGLILSRSLTAQSRRQIIARLKFLSPAPLAYGYSLIDKRLYISKKLVCRRLLAAA